jgi:hypothetical protein
MDHEELQGYYLRIVSGYTLVETSNVVYKIYDPRINEQFLGRNFYQKVLLELVSKGVPTEDQAMILLRDKGLWSDEKDQQIKDLQSNLKKLNISLQDLQFKSVEKKAVTKYIEHTQMKIKELQIVKNSLLVNSAEFMARYELYKYYIYLLTRTLEDKRVWASWTEFTHTNTVFINYLVNEAYASNNIDETVVRKLARSEPWRSTWLAAVKTGDLFGRPTTELTDYQRALVGWSMIYDNAYESPDCPSIDIIDNDILFDKWLESQSEKRKKESVDADNIIKNSRIRNAGEVFIMADSQEDAEKVYKLNDPVAMSSVKTRENKLKEKGTLREIDLPDVRKRLQMESNNLLKDKFKG